MKKITGRPTKFKKEYCEMLIDHLRSGLSFESFGGVVGVSKQTLYDWEKANPLFLDSKKIGMTACQLYWEKVGRDGLYHETIKDDDGMTVNRSINSTIWIFNMKNRFNWRDKLDTNQNVEVSERPFEELSDSELVEKLRGDE